MKRLPRTPPLCQSRSTMNMRHMCISMPFGGLVCSIFGVLFSKDSAGRLAFWLVELVAGLGEALPPPRGAGAPGDAIFSTRHPDCLDRPRPPAGLSSPANLDTSFRNASGYFPGFCLRPSQVGGEYSVLGALALSAPRRPRERRGDYTPRGHTVPCCAGRALRRLCRPRPTHTLLTLGPVPLSRLRPCMCTRALTALTMDSTALAPHILRTL